MRIIKNIGLLLLSILLAGFSACEESEEITGGTPSRLFRPANLSFTPDKTTVSWTPVKGSTYQLEVGRNKGETFETAVGVQTFMLTTSSFTFPELWGSTRYTVRIKSVSNDPDIKDSEYNQASFTTSPENIIVSYLNEIGSDWITLHWSADEFPVSHIHVEWLEGRGGPFEPFDAEVSPEEAAAGAKKVEGLVARSKYRFTVYTGERMRGDIEIITER